MTIESPEALIAVCSALSGLIGVIATKAYAAYTRVRDGRKRHLILGVAPSLPTWTRPGYIDVGSLSRAYKAAKVGPVIVRNLPPRLAKKVDWYISNVGSIVPNAIDPDNEEVLSCVLDDAGNFF